MSRYEDCEKKAEEWRKRAAGALSETARAEYLLLAEMWESLAEDSRIRAERHGRRDAQ